MGTHKYNYNWNFFEEDSEELYYFLGFVAADGYISNNEIEIGLSEKDVCLLERFRDLIVPDKPLYHRKRTNSYTLKISCKKYIERFKNFYGMTTNKKHEEMTFPNIPEQYVKDFIRGYIDGDGCIDTTKAYKGENVYVGQRLRILGNYEFLNSLNAETKKIVSHNTNTISQKGTENVYVITYNFKTANNILHWLYDDCTICLPRKQAKVL